MTYEEAKREVLALVPVIGSKYRWKRMYGDHRWKRMYGNRSQPDFTVSIMGFKPCGMVVFRASRGQPFRIKVEGFGGCTSCVSMTVVEFWERVANGRLRQFE